MANYSIRANIIRDPERDGPGGQALMYSIWEDGKGIVSARCVDAVGFQRLKERLGSYHPRFEKNAGMIIARWYSMLRSAGLNHAKTLDVVISGMPPRVVRFKFTPPNGTVGTMSISPDSTGVKGMMRKVIGICGKARREGYYIKPEVLSFIVRLAK